MITSFTCFRTIDNVSADSFSLLLFSSQIRKGQMKLLLCKSAWRFLWMMTSNLNEVFYDNPAKKIQARRTTWQKMLQSSQPVAKRPKIIPNQASSTDSVGLPCQRIPPSRSSAKLRKTVNELITTIADLSQRTDGRRYLKVYTRQGDWTTAFNVLLGIRDKKVAMPERLGLHIRSESQTDRTLRIQAFRNPERIPTRRNFGEDLPKSPSVICGVGRTVPTTLLNSSTANISLTGENGEFPGGYGLLQILWDTCRRGGCRRDGKFSSLIRFPCFVLFCFALTM